MVRQERRNSVRLVYTMPVSRPSQMVTPPTTPITIMRSIEHFGGFIRHWKNPASHSLLSVWSAVGQSQRSRSPEPDKSLEFETVKQKGHVRWRCQPGSRMEPIQIATLLTATGLRSSRDPATLHIAADQNSPLAPARMILSMASRTIMDLSRKLAEI